LRRSRPCVRTKRRPTCWRRDPRWRPM
jgi:hypothetical protein